MDEEEVQSFREDVQEVIDKHFEEFDDGDCYFQVRKAFDDTVSEAALTRKSGMRKASSFLGVSHKTFLKMIRDRD